MQLRRLRIYTSTVAYWSISQSTHSHTKNVDSWKTKENFFWFDQTLPSHPLSLFSFPVAGYRRETRNTIRRGNVYILCVCICLFCFTGPQNIFLFRTIKKKNRKIEYTHGGHPLTFFIIISSFSFTSWWRATKKKTNNPCRPFSFKMDSSISAHIRNRCEPNEREFNCYCFPFAFSPTTLRVSCRHDFIRWNQSLRR